MTEETTPQAKNDALEADAVRQYVREAYAQVAENTRPTNSTGCCSPAPAASLDLGYSKEDLAAVPEGANMGLGCGNPRAIADLRPGETVLDLGSGGGFDCFLAAAQVGTEGHVIGVDMTPAMVTKARQNVATQGLANVDIRLGEIEHLPVADASVDVILSNCVINLSPDRAAVFAESYRVLAPGGRLAISDVVALQPIPTELQAKAMALVGCVAGAATAEQIKGWLHEAGFESVKVEIDSASREFIKNWVPGSGAEKYVAAAQITAEKAGRVAPPETTSASPCCATPRG
ncbi:MAG: arsenite methyltransferase [Myxococcota bacterium]